MKKQAGSVLAGMMAAVLLLTGCGTEKGNTGNKTEPDNSGGSQSGKEEEVTLKLFHNWINVDQAPYFEDLAEEFEAYHPNVHIVIENVGDPDYKSKLKVMLGADDAPDIFFSWSGEFAYKFARTGSVMDLSKYYEADGEWKDSFIPAALKPFEYDEGIYGVPVRIDCKMMTYNKEMFEEYGVDVPKTWEEFLEVCETFKKAGIVPIAFGDAEAWAACHYISTFNGQCVPQDIREADCNYETGEFKDEGYIEALNMLKTLNDKGYFTPNTNAVDYEVARNDFLIGKSPMTYVQAIEFKDAVTNNIHAGVFPLPAPENAKGNKNLVTGSPDGFMISSKCKNPDIAIEFLKLATSPKWQERMITQLSSPASVKGIHNEENSDEVTLEAVALYEKADGFVNWLDSDIHSKIAEVYLPGLQEVIAGTTSPEDLMKKVQETAKEVQNEAEE